MKDPRDQPETEHPVTGDRSAITLFWRPACGFCAVLRRDLESSGLPIVEVNIWDDPEAARVVQRLANGNETVPTVLIGTIDDPDHVGLVNPSAAQVLDAVATHAPHLRADGH
ncbi:MAG: NrdH-redoxin [Actinomycetota bacterium]|nr:NrdH-redoxin [Actinomycetota bacterium]